MNDPLALILSILFLPALFGVVVIVLTAAFWVQEKIHPTNKENNQ